MNDTNLPLYLTLWMCAVAALAAVPWWRRTPSTGLVLAYVFNLWMIHWLAPALYLFPWHWGFDPEVVQAGLVQSLYAVVSFAFGSLVLTPLVLDFGVVPRTRGPYQIDSKLPLSYVGLGSLSYIILSLGIDVLPSGTAFFAMGQQLVVVGLILCCWHAWRRHEFRKVSFWIALTLLIPLVTIVTRGFIGYGAVATLSVLIFVSRFVRSRALVLATGVLVVYLGLSVYVTYMRDRNDIRETVWGGQSFEDRFAQLGNTAANFEWFDATNVEHLVRVDNRLNQTYLVGLAVNHLTEGEGYAQGRTLWEALIAVVPRALWWDKPVQAGSGDLVSEYTGLSFAAGTSVGIGQVMEFYVNFGTTGVIIGLALVGLFLSILDIAAAEHLNAHNLHGFVLWFLPGISLLQVGGSLVEMTSSAAASAIVAIVANKYLNRLQRKRAVRLAQSGPPRSSQTHERLFRVGAQ
jgi:hypothetical protein